MLLDKDAIRDVVLRYCRGIDRMDAELVRSCYHPDATDEHGSFSGPVDEFVAWCWHLLEKYDSTTHVVANQLIEVAGSGIVAVSETYGFDVHTATNPDPALNMAVGFRYLDRFERRAGGPWLIAKRICTTEWTLKAGEDQRFPVSPKLRVGERDRRDVIYALLAEAGISDDAFGDGSA